MQRDHPDLTALALSGPVIRGNPQVEALLTMDPLPEVPIDPSILSRDSADGDAYASDELVYHGPFHRKTLEAIFAAVRSVGSGPNFGDLPALWIQGEGDMLAPLAVTQEVVHQLRGGNFEEHIGLGVRRRGPFSAPSAGIGP